LSLEYFFLKVHEIDYMKSEFFKNNKDANIFNLEKPVLMFNGPKDMINNRNWNTVDTYNKISNDLSL
jgi:hypothetical protein